MTHFSWFYLLSDFGHKWAHVLSSALVFVVLLSLCFFARKSLLKAKENAPSSKIGIKAFFELLIEFIYNLSESVMGKKGLSLVPLFSVIFIYVFISNVLGLVPGFTPPTDNLNTTIALGLFSFLLYNFYGFKEHGLAYLKHFLGPVLFLAPLMLVLEIISHIFRPLSLGLRLYGNMVGDHTVLSIFLDLSPVLVPVIFYFLGLFVCAMQAFVFTILSMIYVSMATAHDH